MLDSKILNFGTDKFPNILGESPTNMNIQTSQLQFDRRACGQGEIYLFKTAIHFS